MLTPRKTNQKPRRGTAAVEAAACFPLVVMLVLGSIELTAGYFHQNTIRATVHECAKIAARGPSTADDVQTMANALLTQRDMGIGYTIQIDAVPRTVNINTVEPAAGPTSFTITDTGAPPIGLDEVPRGTLLRLRLTATRPAIAGIGIVRYLNPTMNAECHFLKEI